MAKVMTRNHALRSLRPTYESWSAGAPSDRDLDVELDRIKRMNGDQLMEWLKTYGTVDEMWDAIKDLSDRLTVLEAARRG